MILLTWKHLEVVKYSWEESVAEPHFTGGGGGGGEEEYYIYKAVNL